MQIQTGIDIIEVKRIQEAIENKEKDFYTEYLHGAEIAYCDHTGKMKYQHYAARFAAKEATFKAISEQIDDKYSISWKDIEISNNLQGRPKLKLIGIKLNNIENIDLSISHCKEYAVANVTLLKNRIWGRSPKTTYKGRLTWNYLIAIAI